MNPLFVFTDTSLEIPPKMQTRDAVRAVMIRDGLVLVMYSTRDKMVGTPGGGITLNESKLDTLYRELLEEVGGRDVRILEHLGFTEEIRKSRSQNKLMRILTDYYYVEVKDFIESSLEEHEEEMGLEPRWMTIDEAISVNEECLNKQENKELSFYHSQTQMLKYIKDRFGL